MEGRAAQRKEEKFIPFDVLERAWEGDITKMTLGGVKPSQICRCIADGIKPYKLGQRGRRKVSFWEGRRFYSLYSSPDGSGIKASYVHLGRSQS